MNAPARDGVGDARRHGLVIDTGGHPLEGPAPPDRDMANRLSGMRPARPVHTYSIVARDPRTGDLGGAVQSHWFNVGPLVLWGRAGVGVVATQSICEPAYGPLGLDRMALGQDAAGALAALVADDEQRDVRQVAMVDARGRTAAHTGARCIADAGHVVGDGVSVQANMMASPAVWPAMVADFDAAAADPAMDLAACLLAALRAGQDAGGDFRGRQSAAILVVRGEATGPPWEGPIVDLRVEDHPDPVGELERLVDLGRAYAAMNAGDAAAGAGRWLEALAAYADAAARAPHIPELGFWHAVGLVHAGRADHAIRLFGDVFARDPRWRDAVGRIAEAGLLPADPELLGRIRSAGGA
jgi:uncharacterized Ntn-hydrolase superfamily protein